MTPRHARLALGLTLLMCATFVQIASAHEKTRLTALAQAEAEETAEPVDRNPERSCKLTINLVDSWTKETVPGIVRVTNLSSGKHPELPDEFHRAANWYAIEEGATVLVPRAKIRIEALRGLRTTLATGELDLRGKAETTATLELKEFYETKMRGIYGGNTHLHLMKMTHAEADRYLRLVPRADNLDLVFLSHLRRVPDERDYVSNQIVENSFAGGDLERLSQAGVLFGNGQEHRHNFGGYGEGYGHVMLLNIKQLIRPVSLGPGIMQSGTDGRPLNSGILAAHRDAATVIWCHNTFGLEDLPNWTEGLVHAQNIFDGGAHGSYADTFYRYLNLGLQVPFSTGTDWFIYDFARAYVPVDGELTVEKWLSGLRKGRSYITNGPFLELDTERAAVGGTLKMTAPNRVTVVGRGMGRVDFRGLELVYNGKVVHRTKTRAEDGYFTADLRHGLRIDKPGWFAMRVPLDAGKTELNKPLFAHTSPIYVTVGGKKIFDIKTAEAIVEEMESNLAEVLTKGRFENSDERNSVASVYRRAISRVRVIIKTRKARDE